MDFGQYLVDLDGAHDYIYVICPCILANTAWNMAPFLGSTTHLRGCHRQSKESCIFQHIHNCLKGIDLFNNESVHRCSLGCSTCPVLDLWTCHQLAVCWTVKC